MQMSPKSVNYGGKKPRFRRGTVFAKNLGFGVGFGYRNNSTVIIIEEKTVLGRKENFAPGKILSGKEPPKCILLYIVYQPRRRPNIVQSLVGLQ